MASLFKVAFFLFLGLMVRASQAQLCPTFYDESCPDVSNIVRGVVKQALAFDERAGARLIRLHFHDCFVNGCDGSVLLEDQPGVVSELGAPGNANITGFNIVNNIKAAVEKACPGVVSCADILAIASVEAVNLAGGPCWEVQLGRRDSRRANLQGAIDGLPSPFEDVTQLKRKFGRVGLDSTDLVALSGAHTFGKSRCRFFDRRLNVSNPDNTLDARFAQQLRRACSSSRDTFVNLDPTTPNQFDKNYYTNLQSNIGLLGSDQVLHSTPGEDTVDIVNVFAVSQQQFFDSFGQSMINMGNIRPLTGAHTFGKSRCRFFDRRLNVSNPDNTLDARFAQQLRRACSSSRDTFVNLDPTTPNQFDKNYYTNLQSNIGLLGSDQVLHSTPGEDTVDIVNVFAVSQQQFFDSFGQSMINMGNIRPLTGNQGEIRSNCRRLN